MKRLALACIVFVACPAEDTREDTTVATEVGDAETSETFVPVDATLIIEPPELDFERVAIDEDETLPLELENAGSEPIEVNDIAVDSDDGFFNTNLRSVTIPAGEKRVVLVTFYAHAAGQHDDILRLRSNAQNGPTHVVQLRGRGEDAACVDADQDLHGANCDAGNDCNDNDPDVHFGALERCNGDDDDCDNLFDEDFVELNEDCDVGTGTCVATGKVVCNDAGDGVVCDAEVGAGVDELCNSIDDDCDGFTDEDFPSKGDACSVGAGQCRVVDKWTCASDGTRLECPVSGREPQLEVCNNDLDDDCDSITDEGQIEVCADSRDNDCDGVTDESGSRWGELFFARDLDETTVSVYPAVGDGTFEDPIALQFSSNNRFSVHAVGDFDGDRWLDLIVIETVTEGRTQCTISANCGAGFTCADGLCRKLCVNNSSCTAFATEQCVDTRSHVVDQDTYCLPPKRVLLARSACSGPTSITLTQLFVLPPGDELGPVVDLDGNGHLDFVGLQYFGRGKVGVRWMNDGDGHFAETRPAFDYTPLFGSGTIGNWQWGLARAAKDLTGDGFADVIGVAQKATSAEPTDFFLLAGKGDGTFETMRKISAQIPNAVNLVTISDFDGDGDQDIVGGLDEDGQPGAAYILLNRVSDTTSGWLPAYPIFDVAPSYEGGAEHPGLGNGASWDFDGDDQPDVLAAWTPEECGSFIYGCTDVQDPGNICYGGDCRKLALFRNKTDNPCDAGESCVAGQCQTGCTPACEGRSCGSDGCGGTCGRCDFGQICTSDGACVVDCVPQCDGKSCGDNGCGGECGTCPGGFSCVGGQCTNDCVPQCDGKSCGDDGCGSACAVFSEPLVIAFDDNPAVRVATPTNVPPTKPTLAMDPPTPGPNADLRCTIATPSYDLDPVEYRYAWYRGGLYQKVVGDRARVSADLTEAGQTWTCRVFATDGIERSPLAEISVQIAAPR